MVTRFPEEWVIFFAYNEVGKLIINILGSGKIKLSTRTNAWSLLQKEWEKWVILVFTTASGTLKVHFVWGFIKFSFLNAKDVALIVQWVLDDSHSPATLGHAPIETKC